jgi:hypothetical protein
MKIWPNRVGFDGGVFEELLRSRGLHIWLTSYDRSTHCMALVLVELDLCGFILFTAVVKRLLSLPFSRCPRAMPHDRGDDNTSLHRSFKLSNSIFNGLPS